MSARATPNPEFVRAAARAFAALALGATVLSTAAAEANDKPGTRSEAQADPVVSGDFPGSFKLPGPDRSPPAPRR